MLKLSMIEFLLRTIPEAFLFILGIYFLSGKFLNKKKVIILTSLFSIIVYIVRCLPIHYGIHTLINILFLIFLSVKILKISNIKAISCIMLLIIDLYMCEFINILLVHKIFKVSLEVIKFTLLKKIIYSTPSLFLFALSVLCIYICIYRTNRIYI